MVGQGSTRHEKSFVMLPFVGEGFGEDQTNLKAIPFIYRVLNQKGSDPIRPCPISQGVGLPFLKVEIVLHELRAPILLIYLGNLKLNRFALNAFDCRWKFELSHVGGSRFINDPIIEREREISISNDIRFQRSFRRCRKNGDS